MAQVSESMKQRGERWSDEGEKQRGREAGRQGAREAEKQEARRSENREIRLLDFRKNLFRISQLSRRWRNYRPGIDVDLLALVDRLSHIIFTDEIYGTSTIV